MSHCDFSGLHWDAQKYHQNHTLSPKITKKGSKSEKTRFLKLITKRYPSEVRPGPETPFLPNTDHAPWVKTGIGRSASAPR